MKTFKDSNGEDAYMLFASKGDFVVVVKPIIHASLNTTRLSLRVHVMPNDPEGVLNGTWPEGETAGSVAAKAFPGITPYGIRDAYAAASIGLSLNRGLLNRTELLGCLEAEAVSRLFQNLVNELPEGAVLTDLSQVKAAIMGTVKNTVPEALSGPIAVNYMTTADYMKAEDCDEV